MALAPLAALSVPLATSPEWQESGARFQDKLRAHLQNSVFSDGFQQWLESVDKGITYMDWTYKWTGVDLTQVGAFNDQLTC
jgi:cell division protease FtsH